MKHTRIISFALSLAPVLVRALPSQVVLQADVEKFRPLNAADSSLTTLDPLPSHAMRIKETKGLCDPHVQQHAGYLDVSETGHLFFWHFESRSPPLDDPLVLWLNGGPGGSSMLGLLMEMGPCNVVSGNETELNRYSWNENANIVFLDQPYGTGFSYTDGGDAIKSSEEVAIEVYAFLQLFYRRFPHYSDVPLHIAGESYGGHYVPHIAAYIDEQNKKSESERAIPLESILLGNGLTDPLIQFETVPEYLCEPSPYAILNETICQSRRRGVARCAQLVEACYADATSSKCADATACAWQEGLVIPTEGTTVDPMNVRRTCGLGESFDKCYPVFKWVETYLNNADVKEALGVPSDLVFHAVNGAVNQSFAHDGDHARNSAALVASLLKSGIRVLVYASDLDPGCTNYIGNKRWVLALDTPLREAMNAQEDTKWRNARGQEAGELRIGGKSEFVFARVYEAGHMARALRDFWSIAETSAGS